MSQERMRRLRTVFEAALALPEAEREAFVKASSGDEADFYVELDAMLKAHGGAQPLFESNLETFATRVFEPEGDPYLNHVFEKYHFVRRLDKGGMTWVYLAERRGLGGQVAIKVLPNRLSDERRLLFEREQAQLANLKHGHIALLFDNGTLDDGASFFTMEYIDGLPITEYCDDSRVSFAERLALFRQLCEAVQYLELFHVVHRDLKPDNILVQQGGVVKLIDFGISEREGDPSMRPLSASYMTLPYAAPEQVRKEPTSSQADIYSLGALFYEIVTGRPVFETKGRTFGELKEAVLFEVASKPSTAAKERSIASRPLKPGGVEQGVRFEDLGTLDWEDIDAICATALAKDPAGRYLFVDSLIRDLDCLAQKRPPERRHTSSLYKTKRFVQRNRPRMIAAATVFAVIVAITSVYTVGLMRAHRRERAEAAKTQRVQKFLETILEGGDPNNGPSGGLTVAKVLDHAVKDAKTLNTDPGIQAELNQTLASIYTQLGDYATAESLFQTTLQEKFGLYKADSLEIADTWSELAETRLSEGKNNEAKDLVNRALAIDRKKLGEASPQTAEATLLLSLILNDTGHYKEAADALEKIVPYESGKDGQAYDLSATLSNLGSSYFYLGQFDRAEGLFLRSLEIDRKLKGDENLDVAQDLMSMGTLYTTMNRLPQAEAAERKALAINQHWYDNKDSSTTAASMTMLADTLSNEDKYSEALPFAKEGMAMRERLQEQPTGGFAHAWAALGLIDEGLGNFAEAVKDFSRSVAMYKAVLASPNYQIGTVLSDLADAEGHLKQYRLAEKDSREALQMLMATLPADDTHIGRAEAHFGEILYADHQPEEAEAEFRAAQTVFAAHGSAFQGDLDFVTHDLAKLASEKTRGAAAPGTAKAEPPHKTP